jgi:hypothetical protein
VPGVWMAARDPADVGGDEPRWSGYGLEVLDHLRAPWRQVTTAELGRTGGGVGTLVLSNPSDLPRQDAATVADWVRRGGRLLLIGGAGPLAGLAGVVEVEPIDEGHVYVDPTAPGGEVVEVGFRAFGGVRFRVESAQPLAWWDRDRSADRVAICSRRAGWGRCVVLGPDVWQTIVRIQQGWPVVTDAVPAPDGSAPVDDGILKSDDAISLSYTEDRGPSDRTAPKRGAFRHQYPAVERPPFFHRAQADLWRTILVRTLWSLESEAGHPSVWLHYWPAGVEAVAHLSHDTDGNRDHEAEAALDVFDEAGVRTTWCFLYPGGLSPGTVQAVRDAGHELALHFNALDDLPGCGWGLDELRRQRDWLSDLVGSPVLTNKNHFLRWEGWDEFFVWSERLGIQVDQSHGPSKQGNVGFPFGSCHLSFPMLREGRRCEVLTLPLQCQDLALTTPVANRDLLVEQVRAVHGVFHCLFHGANIAQHPEVRAAVLDTVAAVRRDGLPWWTSAELNAWERARRGVDLRVDPLGDGWLVRAHSRLEMRNAGVMVALPGGIEGEWHLARGYGELRTVVRHDVTQLEIATDLPKGGESVFVISRSS